MPNEVGENSPNTPFSDDAAMFNRIVDILEEARSHVARTVNSTMVVAYWLIGREIIEEEQKGQKRADYGKALLQDLSRRLNERYGRGISVTTLQDCRIFYLTYLHRMPLQHPLGVKFTMSSFGYPEAKDLTQKQHSPGVKSESGFHPAKFVPLSSPYARYEMKDDTVNADEH